MRRSILKAKVTKKIKLGFLAKFVNTCFAKQNPRLGQYLQKILRIKLYIWCTLEKKW